MKYIPHQQVSRLTLLALLSSLGLVSLAHAGGNGRNLPLLPLYQQECASCHIAYPPTLMPAASWSRVLNNLSRHFGSDASLDPVASRDIASWVKGHAGTYKRVSEEPPEDRITRTVWFGRKHREVAATTWKLASVKSPANCTACHTQADSGDFDERHIRTPQQ